MENERFLGFYLSLLPKQKLLEDMIFQFYFQLTKKLKLFKTAKVFINSDAQADELTEELFRFQRSEPPNPYVRDRTKLEYILLRGDYVQVFQDGYVISRFLHFALQAVGKSSDMINEQVELYTKQHRTHPHLRASFWFISKQFILSLPAEFQVAFNVDCLLYGEWQVNHPNLICLHLLALAWMLGARPFHVFLPNGMLDSPAIVQPLFGLYPLPRTIEVRSDAELWKLARLKAPPGMLSKPSSKTAGGSNEKAKATAKLEAKGASDGGDKKKAIGKLPKP